MKTSTLTASRLNFQELELGSIKFYLLAALFVAGNIILPYLCHQFSISGVIGGKIFLPIYFLVLIGAYQFGWKFGLTTAIFSPLVSHLITSRPVMELLPIILIKSVVLVLLAAYIAKKTKKL